MKKIFYFLFILIISCNKISNNNKNFDKGLVKTETIATKKTYDNSKPIEDRTNWNNLDYLKEYYQNYPFKTEDSIIGKGVIRIGDVNFYNTKFKIQDINSKSFYIIENIETDVITEFNGKKYKRDDSNNPLNPRVFITNPDYFRLILDCNNENDKNYIVIVDRKNLKKGLINKSDKNFKFQTIEEYIEDYASLGVDFDRENNMFYKFPNEESEIIKNELQKKYKIWTGEFIEMKGDWLKLKLNVSNEIGWIRWRKGNKILIGIYYIC